MKTWNIGIVGAGLIADFHAKAIGDIPNARLAGVCDKVRDKAAALADKYACPVFDDYQAMVQSADIDVITIATPSGFHMEPAVAAAEAGKHVLCEKPLEVTLERIDAMITAHAKAGTQLGGIFPTRYKEAVAPLRQALAQGRFGTITYAGVFVPWWRGEDYYKDSWHGTWKLDGGGALMNQSIHIIDLLQWLMAPVEALQGFCARPGHPQIETEDTAVACLKFANGALGSVYGTTASWPGQFMRLEITGTAGTAHYVENTLPVWQFAEERPEDAAIREQFSKAQAQGGVSDPSDIPYHYHTRNIEAFLQALDGGTEFEVSGPEARKAVELIVAIYRSSRQEGVVRFDA